MLSVSCTNRQTVWLGCHCQYLLQQVFTSNRLCVAITRHKDANGLSIHSCWRPNSWQHDSKNRTSGVRISVLIMCLKADCSATLSVSHTHTHRWRLSKWMNLSDAFDVCWLVCVGVTMCRSALHPPFAGGVRRSINKNYYYLKRKNKKVYKLPFVWSYLTTMVYSFSWVASRTRKSPCLWSFRISVASSL